MGWRTFDFLRLVVALSAAAGASRATLVVEGDPADAVVRNDGSRVSGQTGRAGASTSFFESQRGGRAAVYVFRLPVPPAGSPPAVSAAAFRFTVVADYPGTAYNLDLYGLGARPDPTVLAGDYYAGPLDTTDAWRIADDLIPAAHGDRGARIMTLGAAGELALVRYLNEQYATSPTGTCVFLRLNPDVLPGSEDTGVDVAFAERVGSAPQLMLSVPEPACAGWLIAGVLSVIRLPARRPARAASTRPRRCPSARPAVRWRSR